METGSALKPETCLYLYAVVSRVPENLNEIGAIEAGSNLFAVRSNGFSCIVSSVPASVYCHQTHETPAQQLEWITQRALRHDEIVRHLHCVTTTVPFKFGTLCATPAELHGILDKFQRTFAVLLDRFQAREEWGVKAYMDEAIISRHVADDPQVMALSQGHFQQSPGHAYFLQKKREKLIAALEQEFIGSLSDEIRTRLQEFTDCIVDSGSSLELPGKSLRLVLTAALLIDKEHRAALEAALAQIESDYAGYLLVTELSGPWPPYSFSADVEGLPNKTLDGQKY